MRLPVLATVLLVAFTAPAAAQRLPGTATPEHYDLAFTVDLPNERFSGSETIHVRVNEPTSRIVLNAAELHFNQVTVSAGSVTQRATVSLDERDETATLTVARPLAPGPAELRIRYTGVLSKELRGFYISRTSRRKYAVTQFESTDARRAFPSFDEPALKATFAIALTVDGGDTAISNGRLLSDTPGPGSRRHTLQFAPTPRMSSYLVAMAIGDFKCLDGSEDRTPIRVCATPEKASLGSIALESAKEILKYYNGYYGLAYPFGKLDLVAIPDFAAGAMENTAAIFFREGDLLADTNASVATRKNIALTIAHEIAHQWFGDLVTMQWWDDLWLNEGFASWMSRHPLQAWKPEWHVDVDEVVETQRALTIDSSNSTHPIRTRVERPADIEGAFDAITYDKGAAILRMIENYVGAETFRAGVNAYLRAHAYQTATSEDFWKAIADAARRPIDKILPTFVDQPGVPLIEVSATCEDGKTITRSQFHQQRFTLDRPPDTGSPTPVWLIPVCIKIQGSSTAASCPVLDKERQVVEVAHGCPSWVFINSGAHGYFRTAYPPPMLRDLARDAAIALTASERLTLIEDEWALVRAGRHTAGDYLTLAGGFGREQTSGVLSRMAEHLRFIDEYLTADPQRPALQAFVRSLLQQSFDDLGIEAAASDSDDRRALRATVVSSLGSTGADAQVAAQSRAALERALDGGARLDATDGDALTMNAAAQGDAHLYDVLSAAATRTTMPSERDRYLKALTSFRDTALIDRALQFVRSPQMRSHDVPRYLSWLFDNPSARDRAWAFVKRYWTDIEPSTRVAFGEGTLVRSLGAFCDPRARDDIRDFFNSHPLRTGGRVLEASLERIDNCVKLRNEQTPIVSDWLNRRGGG